MLSLILQIKYVGKMAVYFCPWQCQEFGETIVVQKGVLVHHNRSRGNFRFPPSLVFQEADITAALIMMNQNTPPCSGYPVINVRCHH